jgi:Protein of unknown function (DUF3006)
VSVQFSLSVDRFEGKAKPIAVLLTDDGETISLPKSLLPPAAKPGDVLSVSLEIDAEATRTVAEQTRRLQDKLSHGDSGGEIKL